MRSVWLCLLFCAATALTGCTTAQAVYLKDSAGHTAQCGPYTKLGNIPMEDEAAELKMRSCVSKLEQQGYERIPSPAA